MYTYDGPCRKSLSLSQTQPVVVVVVVVVVAVAVVVVADVGLFLFERKIWRAKNLSLALSFFLLNPSQ